MAKIFILGENHYSREDAEKLEAFDFSKIKKGIFFQEGREEKGGNTTLFLPEYYLLKLGFWELGMYYQIMERINRRPSLDDFIERESRRWEFEIDKKIDASLSEIYGFIDRKHKIALFSFLLLIFLFSLCGIIAYYPPNNPLSLITWVLFIVCALVIFVLTPVIYSFAIISFTGYVNMYRDRHMIEHIDRKIKNKKYDQALVLCGHDHVPGIRKGLKDKGHTVKVIG